MLINVIITDAIMFFNKQYLNNEQNFEAGCDMNVVLDKSVRIDYFFKKCKIKYLCLIHFHYYHHLHCHYISLK